jgi:hypothetical protein
MKRLFYSTNDLDDAELISDEVHKQGIDDQHFFVLSRDDKGILSHHLHGGNSFDNTSLLATGKRAGVFAFCILALVAIIGVGLVEITMQSLLWLALVCSVAFAAAKMLASIVCASFDSYFKDTFDRHLDNGEVIVIIDVTHDQSPKIMSQLKQHSAVSFIAESSNIVSPMPS